MDFNSNANFQAMLTSKNFTILEDQLTHEALSNKKLSLYSNYCTDSNLKNLCQQAAQMHKRHFDTLFNYLKSENKPQQ